MSIKKEAKLTKAELDAFILKLEGKFSATKLNKKIKKLKAGDTRKDLRDAYAELLLDKG